MHHTGVEWTVKKKLLNNLICHKLGVLSFLLKKNGFWIMWEVFFLVVALVYSISVPMRTQATFLLLSVGNNVIIMPSRYLYKEHLVIIF